MKPVPGAGKLSISFLVLALVLGGFTASAYWDIRDHQFLAIDDDQYVTNNHIVRAGLTRDGLKWAFTESLAANWHPLTWLSHMLDGSSSAWMRGSTML